MKSERKILIFGAGFYGKNIAKSLLKKGELIVGFVDNNPALQETEIRLSEDVVGTYTVFSPNRISNLIFDEIIIAIDSKKHVDSIKVQLSQIIDLKKVALKEIMDIELHTDALAEHIAYNEYTDHRIAFLRDFARFVYDMDIEGNVAECGVWLGDFSFYMNKYFADRTCYLFDTFEGFSQKDIETECSLNDERFTNGVFASTMHFQTELDQIKIIEKKLPNIEKCIIKKGYFPESAVGVEDKFCFVNLDMDLYAPMYAGLEFFYEKMSNNGVLLLHDYFHPELPGVKKAVDDFECKLNKPLIKLPIGDSGSLAIIKME